MKKLFEKKGRYDKLFEKVSKWWLGEPGTREPAVLAARVVRSKKDMRCWHSSQRHIVLAFAQLSSKNQLSHAVDYFRRHPPPPTVEEVSRRNLEKNPWLHIFIGDHIGPGASMYDASLGEFTLEKRDGPDGALFWKPLAPWSIRKVVSFPLTDIKQIPGALVKFAAAQGLAFKIDLSTLEHWGRKFSAVFVPRGDSRLVWIAQQKWVDKDKPSIFEVDGLTSGQALLFDVGEDYAGLLAEYHESKASHFGLAVWARFYAVEIEDTGFSRHPEIPA